MFIITVVPKKFEDPFCGMSSPGQGVSHSNQWFFENLNNQTINRGFFSLTTKFMTIAGLGA
jgi:hypothetical protein